MADGGVGPLRVRSDLRLVVGGLSADIVSDGSRITVRTDNPTRLFAEAAAASLPRGGPRATLRHAVGLAGRLLTETGLSAQVDGEHGVIIELGQGCGSRTGRVLLGSGDARLGSARAVVPVAMAYAVSAVRRRTTSVVAGLAVAALLGGLTAGPVRSWRRGATRAGTRG